MSTERGLSAPWGGPAEAGAASTPRRRVGCWPGALEAMPPCIRPSAAHASSQQQTKLAAERAFM